MANPTGARARVSAGGEESPRTVFGARRALRVPLSVAVPLLPVDGIRQIEILPVEDADG